MTDDRDRERLLKYAEELEEQADVLEGDPSPPNRSPKGTA
jgi:hypothetical protein